MAEILWGVPPLRPAAEQARQQDADMRNILRDAAVLWGQQGGRLTNLEAEPSADGVLTFALHVRNQAKDGVLVHLWIGLLDAEHLGT